MSFFRPGRRPDGSPASAPLRTTWHLRRALAGAATLLALGVPTALAGPTMSLEITNSPWGAPIHDKTPLNALDDPNDIPLIGDWDGNGKDEVGMYHPKTRQTVLNERNASDSASSVSLAGDPDDIPLVGRWSKNLGGRDAVALYRRSNGKIYYPTTSDPHVTDGEVWFDAGGPNDIPIVGDWDGDDVDTLGLFRPATATNGAMFYLKNNNQSPWPFAATAISAQPGDKPIVGDWNLDGKDTIGVFRDNGSSAPTFFMSNSAHGIITPGVSYGDRGDVPTVGDWDGDKEHTFATFRPSNHRFYMRAGNGSQPYGNVPGDFALTGLKMKPDDIAYYADWDGNGTDTPGYYRPDTREMFYANSTQAPTLSSFGPIGHRGDIPVVGRWTNNTWRDMVALFRPSTDTLYYPSGSTPDINASYGVNHTPGDKFLAADWNSDGIDTLGIWRPSNQHLYIRNTNENISWQDQGTIGSATDVPLVGHFRKGYATDTFALFSPSPTMYNKFLGANATADFGDGAKIAIGSPGDKPAIGDWDRDALDTVGVQITKMPAYDGGPDGELNYWQEAQDFVTKYRTLASDGAAAEYATDIWPGELAYVNQHVRDNMESQGGQTLRAINTPENWWVKDGVRHLLANAPAADMVSAPLGAAVWRVTPGARDKFTAGETVDTTNAASWRFGNANGRVDEYGEQHAFLTAFNNVPNHAAAKLLFEGLVPPDKALVAAHLQATLAEDVIYFDVLTSTWWVLLDGYRHQILSAAAADSHGIVLDGAQRVVADALGAWPVGEQIGMWIDADDTWESATGTVSYNYVYPDTSSNEADQYVIPFLIQRAAALCIKYCDDAYRAAAKSGRVAKTVQQTTKAAVKARSPFPGGDALSATFSREATTNASRVLGRNLAGSPARAAKLRARGLQPHHIVPSHHKDAHFARAILQKCGIKANDKANGVWLNHARHNPIQHNPSYMVNVNQALIEAVGYLGCIGPLDKGRVEGVLQRIATGLRTDSFIF